MSFHLWLEAFHIISVISWMCGMLYLPRLYIYHTGVKYESESCKMLQIMERRLLRIIINPAMILTLISGITLMVEGIYYLHGWFHVKAFLVIIMTITHGLLARYRKLFAQGKNKHSPLFYRVLNESTSTIMIIIVILVTVKPF